MWAFTHTLETAVCVRVTLGVRRVRLNTLTNVGIRCVVSRAKLLFGHIQNLSAYANVYTLSIRTIYSRHTLSTCMVRYSYVLKNAVDTPFIRM